jgi:hypothetical protein
MRNLVIATAITVAFGLTGALVWKTDAVGAVSVVPHGLSGPMSTPIHPAACNGATGGHGCGGGYTWMCNGNGYCRCVRC